MNLTFVESRAFTSRWNARQDDESLRAMQNELLSDPSRGDPIPGCGLLRKLRFGDERRGKGKRGGVRVIYLHTPEAHRIDLLAVYGKDEADDLSKEQLKVLCVFAKALRLEATEAFKRSRPKRKD
jgi:mRNA-degrading endonuclease RelE of RelBE toxin-antitoxin system